MANNKNCNKTVTNKLVWVVALQIVFCNLFLIE